DRDRAGGAWTVHDVQASRELGLHALGDKARHHVDETTRRIASEHRHRLLRILRSSGQRKAQADERGSNSYHAMTPPRTGMLTKFGDRARTPHRNRPQPVRRARCERVAFALRSRSTARSALFTARSFGNARAT